MRPWLIGLLLAVSLSLVGFTPAVKASTVRIQPLQVESSLKPGDTKKGFVDISNPSADAVNVKLYVQAFKQVNDKGELKFYDDEQLTKGIKLDYATAQIGGRQTMRLYYITKGAELPTGDVFAAIFAETVPNNKSGIIATARVGTLLFLTNGTPGSRDAKIDNLEVSPLQIGDGLNGTVSIRNPAAEGKVTGFKPKITISLTPLGGKTTTAGPLIFAGRTRTVDLYQPSNLFGVYKLTVQANDAQASKFVVLITGWWRLVLPAVAIIALVVWFGYKLFRRQRIKKVARKVSSGPLSTE